MKIKSLPLLAALCCASVLYAEPPRVIAHRGYWDTPGSAQNSIRALIKADSIGCYASEFDVWMSADSVLLVNHDPTFAGVNLENSPAALATARKLANGEQLPTLEQYLQAAKPLKIRLVLELKAHENLGHEREAIRRILEMVEACDLGRRIDYITFSPTAFASLARLAPPPARVYYLTGNMIPEQVKFLGGAGIDYSISDLRDHPWWIPECRALGLEVNIWTVNSLSDMQLAIDAGVDYITTNRPEELMELLSGRR